MNANQIAMHEVDGLRLHRVVEHPDDFVTALGAEFADVSPVGDTGDLVPLRSHAYRRAAALLSVYRSRVDFLGARALESSVDSFRHRFAPGPESTGSEPAATH
jgi:hypothetical protein